MDKCLEPYKCLNVMDIDGEQEISSCCQMQSWKGSAKNFIDDPILIKIRQEWDNGNWPNECQYCLNAELQGQVSRRQSSQTWLHDNGINDDSLSLVRLDYWCGNTCNLRCAICGPHSSIAWQKELGIKKQHRNKISNSHWEDCDLTQIKWIHFNGGEPLLIDDHWAVLEALPDRSKVKLNYNTNATVLPKPRLIEIWEQCELVVIDFSIDDIGDRFEYQRYPAKWDDVVDNLKWFHDNMPVNVMFEVNATVSVLNQPYQFEIRSWLSENFKTNRVTDPVRYRTQPASGILATGNDILQAVAYLNELDARRGTDWRSIFPILADQAASASAQSR